MSDFLSYTPQIWSDQSNRLQTIQKTIQKYTIGSVEPGEYLWISKVLELDSIGNVVEYDLKSKVTIKDVCDEQWKLTIEDIDSTPYDLSYLKVGYMIVQGGKELSGITRLTGTNGYEGSAILIDGQLEYRYTSNSKAIHQQGELISK